MGDHLHVPQRRYDVLRVCIRPVRVSDARALARGTGIEAGAEQRGRPERVEH